MSDSTFNKLDDFLPGDVVREANSTKVGLFVSYHPEFIDEGSDRMCVVAWDKKLAIRASVLVLVTRGGESKNG